MLLPDPHGHSGLPSTRRCRPESRSSLLRRRRPRAPGSRCHPRHRRSRAHRGHRRHGARRRACCHLYLQARSSAEQAEDRGLDDLPAQRPPHASRRRSHGSSRSPAPISARSTSRFASVGSRVSKPSRDELVAIPLRPHWADGLRLAASQAHSRRAMCRLRRSAGSPDVDPLGATSEDLDSAIGTYWYQIGLTRVQEFG